MEKPKFGVVPFRTLTVANTSLLRLGLFWQQQAMLWKKAGLLTEESL
jgi:hypothetical protein